MFLLRVRLGLLSGLKNTPPNWEMSQTGRHASAVGQTGRHRLAVGPRQVGTGRHALAVGLSLPDR